MNFQSRHHSKTEWSDDFGMAYDPGSAIPEVWPLPHPYIESIIKRRSQHAVGRNLPIAASEVVALIEDAIRHAPSSYNSQSSRAVILLGEEGARYWGIVREVLRAKVAADAFARTEARTKAFAAGAGTILIFEDQETVQWLQAKYPAIADKFPVFSEHSSGMAQFAVWTALANAGIGASLQHHYDASIDAQVEKTWEVPTSWKVRAQMPFGSNEAPLAAKSFIDDKQRFRVFGLS